MEKGTVCKIRLVFGDTVPAALLLLYGVLYVFALLKAHSMIGNCVKMQRISVLTDIRNRFGTCYRVFSKANHCLSNCSLNGTLDTR